MTITRDATKGWWVPADGGEFAELVRGTAIPVPDTLQNCQDASGALADSIGAFTFSPIGTGSYHQAATGWSRLALSTGDGVAGSWRSVDTALPDIASASVAQMIIGIPSTIGGTRSILEQGTTMARYGFTVTPRARVTSVANIATGTVDPTNGQLWFLGTNRTASSVLGQSESDALSPTFGATMTGKRLTIGGAGAVPPSFLYLWHVAWMFSNAELMTSSLVSQLFTLIKQGPVTTSLVFDYGGLVARASAFALAGALPLGATFASPITAGTPAAPATLPTGSDVRPARPPGTVPPQTLALYPTGAPAATIGSRPHLVVPPRPAWRPPSSGFVAPPAAVAAQAALAPMPRTELPRDPRRAPSVQALAVQGPVQPFPPLPVIVGVGPAGAATFVLSLLDGTKVTYAWSTDITKAYSGLEWRASILAAPRQRYEGPAYLTDGDDRTVRAAMTLAAAQGLPFLLALPFEELAITADATGTVVPVATTAFADWANPGQRVVCVGPDDSVSSGVVQSVTSSTITLDVAPGSAGQAAGKIMPAMAVYLDAQQGFARSAVAVDQWNLKAQAALFGFGGVDTMGIGTTLSSFNGRYVWDRGNGIEGQAAESMDSMADLLDLGAAVAGYGTAAIADWGRTVRMEGVVARDDLQWLKALLYALRGNQLAFYLPTNHHDAVFVSNPGGAQLVIAVPPTPGAGNFAIWFVHSTAHGALAITKADGSVQYVTILGLGDNGDGTGTLNLSATVTGTVRKISFLELVRFESSGSGADSVELSVTFAGGNFVFDAQARVIQQLTDGGLSTYDLAERSVEGSRPIDLYDIVTPIATYRITSHHRDVISGGNTYTATVASRGQQTVTAGGEPREFMVYLPVSHPLAQRYLAFGIPPQSVTVTAWRMQQTLGTKIKMWSADATAIGVDGGIASLLVPAALSSAGGARLPVVVASRTCNNALYDGICTVARASFTVSTTILSVTGTTLIVASMGAHPSSWAGTIHHAASNEDRMVTRQLGTTLTLDVPFIGAVAGDAIDVYAGCDHSITTCRDKFANVVNFLGLPTVNGEINPWSLHGLGIVQS